VLDRLLLVVTGLDLLDRLLLGEAGLDLLDRLLLGEAGLDLLVRHVEVMSYLHDRIPASGRLDQGLRGHLKWRLQHCDRDGLLHAVTNSVPRFVLDSNSQGVRDFHDIAFHRGGELASQTLVEKRVVAVINGQFCGDVESRDLKADLPLSLQIFAAPFGFLLIYDVPLSTSKLLRLGLKITRHHDLEVKNIRRALTVVADQPESDFFSGVELVLLKQDLRGRGGVETAAESTGIADD